MTMTRKLFGIVAGTLAAALLLGTASAAGGGESSLERAPAEPQQASADIVDTAVAAGQFKTLVAAVQAAGLVETLKGTGPFTVFAPTDAAFAALPAGTVDALLKDPARLREVLLYHVVSGEVRAADAAKLTQATTVQGSAVSIAASGSSVQVGGANVVSADVDASNGVIHVIDRVLLPPSAQATPSAPNTGNAGIAGGGTAFLAMAGLLGLAVMLPLAARLASAPRR
jgi:uncharacterized surface protein with fasciclin (FAS1) repeats